MHVQGTADILSYMPTGQKSPAACLQGWRLHLAARSVHFPAFSYNDNEHYPVGAPYSEEQRSHAPYMSRQYRYVEQHPSRLTPLVVVRVPKAITHGYHTAVGYTAAAFAHLDGIVVE